MRVLLSGMAVGAALILTLALLTQRAIDHFPLHLTCQIPRPDGVEHIPWRAEMGPDACLQRHGWLVAAYRAVD